MEKRSFLYRMAAIFLATTIAFCFLNGGFQPTPAYAQAEDPTPPAETTKLIFIHHSCGENWLTDGNGNLGRTLGENNYFVSDTNYGWGPDSIGDATDIINWPDWFVGPESPRYLAALYAESGQNSYYTRNLPDPGGENQIIMFKSCFPNSNLDGSPGDPPTPGLDFTVGNAKYIYNDLLNYFSTRPDKLFVVITAPPVQDPTFAENARAFNTWLVQDWLRENNYTLNNVAVWDFYNVLTHPDNHHHFVNGAVEYVNSNGRGTSAYATDSGDDHPNAAGNRKATEEFLPMLNIFYNRWRSGAPVTAPPVPTTGAVETPVVVVPPVASDLIDNFESGPPAGSPAGWEPFWDEATQSSMACAPEGGLAYNGAAALHLNFSVVPDSWATCTLLYEQHRDWGTATGLSFYVHASQAGLPFDVITYRGMPGALEGYLHYLETSQEMVDGWAYIELSWDMLLRASWEANAGTPFDPGQVIGMAFGIGTFPDRNNAGEIWIDDVRLMAGAPPVPTEVVQTPAPAITEPPPPVPTEPGAAAPTATAPAPTNTPESGFGGISTKNCCPLSPALALVVGALGLWTRRKKQR